MAAHAALLKTAVSTAVGFAEMKRYIRIMNLCPYSIELHCQSGNDDLGWRTLEYGGNYEFEFRAHVLGVTHFWADAKGPKGQAMHFKVYGEGAPVGHNVFAITTTGVVINGALWQAWQSK